VLAPTRELAKQVAEDFTSCDARLVTLCVYGGVGLFPQQAVLRGLVRQEDIQPGNTVLSHNIADASIKFVSKGVVSDSQRRGWFTRAFDKITPF
jgi:hypothetical protein